MTKGFNFVELLLRSRPYLIAGLSTASGYTTFIGLELYIHWWPIALVLTTAVQSLIVIGTLQLTMAHWGASAVRFLSILLCLSLAMAVSVFFSYFAFYQQFEADHLRQEKFAQLSSGINAYADQVLTAKSQLVAAQIKSINDLREESRMEALGRYGKEGRGPRYRFLVEEVHKQELSLNQMKHLEPAEQYATALKSFLLGTTPAEVGSAPTYARLQGMLAETSAAADVFTGANGLTSIRPPLLMPIDEYRKLIPSLNNLVQISPVAAALAFLVDLFTVFLTFWLESVPFGRVSQEERELVVEEMMQFSEWRVNENDQLDFRLTKTESERSAGVNDGRRTFWATSLLSRGLLKRVNPTRAEFAPRLYHVFSDYFCRRKQFNGDTES